MTGDTIFMLAFAASAIVAVAAVWLTRNSVADKRFYSGAGITFALIFGFLAVFDSGWNSGFAIRFYLTLGVVLTVVVAAFLLLLPPVIVHHRGDRDEE